jgi:hypothetical protein
MKLYRKQLGSLEELKREKIRLKYARMHTKASDLNPLTEIGGSKVSGAAKAGVLGFAMELLSSKSNVQTALALSKPLLKILRSSRARKKEIRRAAGLPQKDSLVKRVVKDVAVNYFIGKALQMSVRAVQLYMRRRKVVVHHKR